MTQERLHKVMANAGVASRRACEELIASGKVTVNGQVVREMGAKVDPERDLVEVDGRAIKPKAEKRFTYIMLYKPPGYLSVFSDERGRQGLEALVKSEARLYPVGRLDADSEGLLLLTDDGELTLRLSHPRYRHVKTYLVLVDKLPGTDSIARFRRGLDLGDGEVASADWKAMDKAPSVQPLADGEMPSGVWMRVAMREGKKRQIRRMAAVEKLGIRRLIRIQIGPLMLDRKLKPGQSRPLTRTEVQRLRMATRPDGLRSVRAQGAGSRGRPGAARRAGQRPARAPGARGKPGGPPRTGPRTGGAEPGASARPPAPRTKPATKPATKPTTKPATRPTTKPAPKPAAKQKGSRG